MRFRKSELERAVEKREKAEFRVEVAGRRAEKAEWERASWPKVTLAKVTPGYLGRFEGEREPRNWIQSFEHDWKQAGSEEGQQEVFKHYLDKLTFSQELGYNRESAGRKLMGILARMRKEEEQGV